MEILIGKIMIVYKMHCPKYDRSML